MTYMVNVGMLVNLMKEHVKYIMTTQASSLNLEQVNMLTAFSFLYSAYYTKTVEIMRLLVRVLTENKTLAALIGENKKADTYAGVQTGGASETPTPTAPSRNNENKRGQPKARFLRTDMRSKNGPKSSLYA